MLPRPIPSVANECERRHVIGETVAAGTPSQVEQVLRSPLLATVIERLENDEFDVKKEAAWVLANMLHGYASDATAYNAQRATTLVQLGCIPGMVKMLAVCFARPPTAFRTSRHPTHRLPIARHLAAPTTHAHTLAPLAAHSPPQVNDAAMQKLMLEAVDTLLAAGETLAKTKPGAENPFVVPFDEADGIDKLEALQSHHNEEIYEKAVGLLERYFGEDDDDDENLLPNTQGNGFTFAAPLSTQQVGFAF